MQIVKVFFAASNGSEREDGKAKYRDSNIVHCQGPWRRMRERIEKRKNQPTIMFNYTRSRFLSVALHLANATFNRWAIDSSLLYQHLSRRRNLYLGVL